MNIAPPSARVQRFFADSIATIQRAQQELSDLVALAAQVQADCLQQGNKILIAGNGGSAADSQHYSSELLNKFRLVRRPLAALSLTADVATLTSISNDESYTKVFAKQVEALARPGDILVVLTSSGNSPNLLEAVAAAHQAKVRCIALNGNGGGKLNAVLHQDDINIVVGSEQTSQIQEVHAIIIHAFCELIDQRLFPE